MMGTAAFAVDDALSAFPLSSVRVIACSRLVYQLCWHDTASETQN
jgi:hypothetical protein